MGQRERFVAMKDVQTFLSREEFVLGMGTKLLAAIKDAQTKFRMEEFVSSMGQRRRLAVVKDVLTKLSEKEFALDMGQRYRSRGRLDQTRGTSDANKKEESERRCTRYEQVNYVVCEPNH